MNLVHAQFCTSVIKVYIKCSQIITSYLFTAFVKCVAKNYQDVNMHADDFKSFRFNNFSLTVCNYRFLHAAYVFVIVFKPDN